MAPGSTMATKILRTDYLRVWAWRRPRGRSSVQHWREGRAHCVRLSAGVLVLHIGLGWRPLLPPGAPLNLRIREQNARPGGSRAPTEISHLSEM